MKKQINKKNTKTDRDRQHKRRDRHTEALFQTQIQQIPQNRGCIRTRSPATEASVAIRRRDANAASAHQPEQFVLAHAAEVMLIVLSQTNRGAEPGPLPKCRGLAFPRESCRDRRCLCNNVLCCQASLLHVFLKTGEQKKEKYKE